MKTILLDFVSDDTAANANQPLTREELLKYERSLKKPVVYHEKPRIMLQTDLSISRKQSNPKPDPNPLPENVMKKIAGMAREKGQEDFRAVLVNHRSRATSSNMPQECFRAVLVTQKVLKKKHISKNHKEFGIPIEDVENRFLSMEEERSLDHHSHSMAVPIIEPTGKVPELHLRRWNLGINGVFYVLDGGWNDVVRENRLHEGATMQLWAFRINEKLHFAFAFLPRRWLSELLRSLASYPLVLSHNNFLTGYP